MSGTFKCQQCGQWVQPREFHTMDDCRFYIQHQRPRRIQPAVPREPSAPEADRRRA